MKKILLAVLVICMPWIASAQDEQPYPWSLHLFGGGATLCGDDGCFGPGGYAFGASFGRNFTDRWGFELEGTYAYAEDIGPARVDLGTGIIFSPTLQHTRIWGGGHFMARIAGSADSTNMYISMGFVGGYEQQKEVVPANLPVFVAPTRDIGIKGGVAGGAGVNLWLGESWGIRPEVRFYLLGSPLSGVRYTAGFLKKF